MDIGKHCRNTEENLAMLQKRGQSRAKLEDMMGKKFQEHCTELGKLQKHWAIPNKLWEHMKSRQNLEHQIKLQECYAKLNEHWTKMGNATGTQVKLEKIFEMLG